jgi:hypothetical protein
MTSPNSPSKPGSKPIPRPAVAKPVAAVMSKPILDQKAVEQPPAPARLRALILSLGVAGGIGKSLNADIAAALCRVAKVPTKMVRLESGARREEFPGDAFIDLDAFTEAQSMLGGIAAHFDPAWALIEATLKEGGTAIMDGGANSHDKILKLAEETGLSQLVAARGGRVYAMVVVTRDADLIRQSVGLVADLRERMPEAEIVIVMNERAGAFVADATREGRAYRDELTPLLERYAHVKMPLAGAKSIAAFASSRRSIPEIMAATDDELRQWSGLPLLGARSCQTHISAFWLDFAAQLQKVLPFRAAE